MTLIPLASKSDPGNSWLVTRERLKNMYAEPSPSGARGSFAIYGTPGLKTYIPISAEIGRGMIPLDDLGTLLSVHGQTLFQIDENDVYEAIAGVLAGVDDLVITRNKADPPQVGFASEAGFFVSDGDDVTQVSDGGLTGFGIPHSVCTIKEFTIAGFDDGTMVASDIGDMTSWDALNFATADANPDELRRVYSFRDELLACGKETVEPWSFDSSNTAFPFSPIPGATIPVGIIGKHAITDLGGSLFWVDQLGIGRTLGQGYQAQRFTNNGIERSISDYLKAGGDRNGIKLFGYVEGGHQFVIIRASTFCWVHDSALPGRPHERGSYRRDTWQAKHYARCFDKHIVSCDISGDLFELDGDTYMEIDDPLQWEIITPPVDAFPNGGVMDRLAIDVETGTALDASGEIQDRNPQFTEEHSIDGGKTWSNPRVVSLGTHAQYRKRVEIHGLGRFEREGVMFRFRGSAAIRMAMLRADLSARPLAA